MSPELLLRFTFFLTGISLLVLVRNMRWPNGYA